jgi:hypothetical protein
MLKRLIESDSGAKVFLDSDQLSEIDLIFDIVRASVRNLIVLLSKMVLTRPWCAGEITTAQVNNVPLCPVGCNDYVDKGEAGMSDLHTLWSEEQKHHLLIYGIDLLKIKDAYRFLEAVKRVELDRFAPISKQEEHLRLVMERCQIPVRRRQLKIGQSRQFAACDVRILISTCPMDAEGRCTCEILASMLTGNLQVACNAVWEPQDALPYCESIQYFIPVLINGLLADELFAEIMHVIEQVRDPEPVEFTPVLADSHFNFPGPEFFKKLKRLSGRGAFLASSFKRMLNVLALPFSPHGSKGLQSIQVHQICMRLKETKKPQRKYLTREQTMSHLKTDLKKAQSISSLSTVKSGTSSDQISAIATQLSLAERSSNKWTKDLNDVPETVETAPEEDNVNDDAELPIEMLGSAAMSLSPGKDLHGYWPSPPMDRVGSRESNSFRL